MSTNRPKHPDPDALDLPDEEAASTAQPDALAPWQILVVDDDPEVHLITRLALERNRFEDRAVEVLSAYSAREARAKLLIHPDIALILLDVVMESDGAGLEFAHHVRNACGNVDVRIVLRTGQAGQIPPQNIVSQYGIDEYRAKTELTDERLLSVIGACLRSYRRRLESRASQ